MMRASKTKSLNKKGELSSLSSQSTRKRTIRKASPTVTRRSSRIERKMKESQANQDNAKDDSQPEEVHTEETPQEHITRLQEENVKLHNIIEAVQREHAYVTGKYGIWAIYNVGKWPKLIRGIVYNMADWAFSYAHGHTRYLDCLSKEQKRQIISSLDGYCVQEDFDSLVSRIPYPMCDHIPAIFAKMSLVKDVFTRCFENPFWYITANPKSGDDGEESEQKDTLFRTELGCLYKKFLQVDPTYARTWRQSTTRLSNTSRMYDQRYTEFGENMHEHRGALINAIGNMSSTTTYQRAAHLSANLCAQHESVEVQNLSDVAPRFHHMSKTAVAEYLHFLKSGSTRLDGHPVLAITQPAVFVCGGLVEQDKRAPILKAELIVEDKCDSEKIGQTEESEKEAASK